MKKCGIIYTTPFENKYLLVCGQKSDKWGFPKGHMEIGETEEQTAIREFYEETGIKVQPSSLEEKLRYKNNIYFRVRGEKIPLNIQDTKEIKLAHWFTFYEILHSIQQDMMNFGLKSWINDMMRNQHKLR